MNKKIFIIIIAVIFLFFLSTIITFTHTKSVKEYENNIYCDFSAMCYEFEGNHLLYYEDVDETENYYEDILDRSCIYTKIFNTCRENIISWDQNRIEIKKGDFIESYYNVEKTFRDNNQIDLTNKVFKNKNLELFFVSNNSVIVSGNNKAQEKCNCYISATTIDDYGRIRYEYKNKVYDKENNSNMYSLDIKNDEILGFQKVTKNQLSRIDFSYFDQNYDYIVDDKYYVTGHYKFKKTQISNAVELRLNKNKVTVTMPNIITGDYNTNEYDLKIVEVNDKYILYDIPADGNQYYYDIKKETICTYNNCSEKID